MRPAFRRAARLALFSVFGLICIVSYYDALSVPIFPDEFAYLRINSHVFNDALTLPNLIPQCIEGNRVKMPMLFFPGAAIYNFVYGKFTSVKYLRFLGLGAFALWLYVLWTLIRSLGSLQKNHQLALFSGSLAVASLGVLPYVNLFSRPEVLMTLVIYSLSVLSAVNLNKSTIQVSKLRTYLEPIFVFALVSLFFFIHPKGVLFFPLLAAFVVSIFNGRARSQAILLLSILIITVVSIRTFGQRAICDEIQNIGADSWNQYLNPKTLLIHPIETAPTLFKNIENAGKYITNILFQEKHPINWLPELSPQQATLAHILNFILTVSLCSLFFACFILFLRHLKIRKLSCLFEPGIPLLALTTFLTILALASVQIVKHFYESQMIFALFILLTLFVSVPNIAKWRLGRGVVALSTMLISISIASQIFLLRMYPRRILRTYSGPNLSIDDYNLHLRNLSILEATKNCQVEDLDHHSHIVVDDMTYLPLRNSHAPAFITYLLLGEDMNGDKSHTQFLRDAKFIGASAVVTRCTSIPAFAQTLAIVSGDICCIKKTIIDRVN